MSFDAEKLYSLLPAVYRIRDLELAQQLEGLLSHDETVELESLRELSPLSEKEAKRLAELDQKRQCGPLKALLSVIAEQAVVLEENLDQLYDDLFIETCAEWVVPYIGELVGARGISTFPGASFTQRALVANTMAYRRRKGTAAVLEQLARDVTDWNASVVEYFQRLATTQYMNHIRIGNLAIASLRQSESVENNINTSFDRIARTADVRRIESGRGKYNIRNIGIFLWRIADYRVTTGRPYKLDDRRYLFDPLGKHTQLFNQSEPEREITHLAEPINVPMPIGRRLLNGQLETYYGVTADGKARSILLTERDPVLVDELRPIEPARIKVCDLSDLVDGSGNVVKDMNGIAQWSHLPDDRIAIDPVLGRITLPANQSVENLHVTYCYGFSADLGGGEYDRTSSFTGEGDVVKVPDVQPTIQSGLDQVKDTGGVVEITNNEQFFGALDVAAEASAEARVELRAAEHKRPVIVLGPNDVLSVSGSDEGEITINGLLIAGGLVRVPSLLPNKLRRLRLVHCTLAPGPVPAFSIPASSPPDAIPAQGVGPRLQIETENTIVEIDRCISGPIRAIAGAEINISNSIIDASSPSGIAFSGLQDDEPGATLRIENSTVIGKVFTESMKLASNTIFLSELQEIDTRSSPVQAERLQEGCVRFSFVPPGSLLPSLHRCQPARQADVARVRPAFTSLRYGEAGYCQLSQVCAAEITNGSDDQVEMGAFHSLYQPRRVANLRAALDEHLRFGLEAGIFYAS